MHKNVIQEKSYDFALKIISVTQELNCNKQFELSRQLLKSGTSIGANVEEAIGGQTRKDFRAKLFIAYKEARETDYWLRLLRDSEILTTAKVTPMLEDCHEIKSILGAILVTLNTK